MLKTQRSEVKRLELRSAGQLLLAACAVLLLACVSLWLQTKHCEQLRIFFEHTQVEFPGLSDADMQGVRCQWYGEHGEDPNCCAHRDPGTNVWQMVTGYVGRLHLEVTPETVPKLKQIIVTCDRDCFIYDAPVFLNWTTCGEKVRDHGVWLVFENDKLKGHTFNSKDEGGYHLTNLVRAGRPYIANAFCVTVLLLLLLRLVRSRQFLQGASAALFGPLKKPRCDRRWFVGGFFVVALSLAAIESVNHYFFVQDDNLSQFFPVMLQGGESLLNGIFPVWNPYQYLGAPTCTMGVYSLTYPFTYLSYDIAARLFHSPFWSLEIFAAIHLLGGYAVTYVLMRQMRVRPAISALAAVSFVLCGYFMIVGRSWYYMLPVSLWAPCLVALTNKMIQREVGLKWSIATGLVIGAFFHAGNAQLWLYALLMCAGTLFIARVVGLLPPDRLKWCIPAVLIGLAVAAPLAILQVYETSSSVREGDAGLFYGISWVTMFLPVGELITDWYSRYIISNCIYPREICYFGVVFAVSALAAVWFLLLRFTLFKGSKQLLAAACRNNIWLPAFAVAIVLACGSEGILWDLLARLPVFNKFSQSGKYLVYVALFGIICGSLIIDRLLTVLKNRQKVQSVLIVVSMLLLAIHLSQCNTSFYQYADQPYPPLPAAIAQILTMGADQGKPQRFLPVTSKRSREPGFYRSISLNFATTYKLPTVFGYDPLVALRLGEGMQVGSLYADRPLDASRNYGVRWLLVQEPAPDPNWGMWNMESVPVIVSKIFSQLKLSYTKILDLPGGGIYEEKDVSPLAFSLSRRQEALPLKLRCDGVLVDVSSVPANDTVVINFQRRPWCIVTLDERRLDLAKDEYYRVAATIPTAGRELRMTYLPPWSSTISLGIQIGLAGLLLGLLMHYTSLQKPRRRPRGNAQDAKHGSRARRDREETLKPEQDRKSSTRSEQ